MLGYIKYAHDDILGVRYNQHSSEGFDDPFEENEGLKIVHVVAVNQELDQLQAHDECKNDPGDWHDHIFRQTLDHVEDAAVPCLGRFSYGGCHIGYAGIDTVK